MIIIRREYDPSNYIMDKLYDGPPNWVDFTLPEGWKFEQKVGVFSHYTTPKHARMDFYGDDFDETYDEDPVTEFGAYVAIETEKLHAVWVCSNKNTRAIKFPAYSPDVLLKFDTIAKLGVFK